MFSFSLAAFHSHPWPAHKCAYVNLGDFHMKMASTAVLDLQGAPRANAAPLCHQQFSLSSGLCPGGAWLNIPGSVLSVLPGNPAALVFFLINDSLKGLIRAWSVSGLCRTGQASEQPTTPLCVWCRSGPSLPLNPVFFCVCIQCT